MKQINYSGSSKLISRIVSLLNRKAPLPLDGDGDPSWGSNGQVLTTDGTGSTYWSAGGGSGDVTDVEVNGTSVVNAQGVAEVSVPTKTSDLNNDSGFIDGTDLSTALADYTPTASLASVATSGQYSDLSGTPSLATVATSGDYDDLTNKPTIPAAQVNSDWNAVSGVAQILNKPTIPTVNDGTLTIQQNGTTVGTFSANQSGNTTVNLTGGGSSYTAGDGINISAQNAISVDTAFTEASTRVNIASGDTLATILGKIKKFFTDLKTVAFTGAYSDLSGTPTIPTKTSQLTNDSGYLTSAAPTSGSAAYVRVANPDPVSGSSASTTFNDLAKKFFAMGMINAATDNPLGSAKWAHGISMAWGDNNNSSWISQIAIGTQNGTGMYYRTNGSGSIVGKAWTRVIDSANIGSQSVNYATSATTASRLGTYWNSYLVTARTSWSVLSLTAPSNVVSVMACPAGRLSNQPQWYVEFSGKSVKLYYKNSVDYSADGYTIWVMC